MRLSDVGTFVGMVVRRTERFTESCFQAWKFRFETAVGGCNWSSSCIGPEGHETLIDPNAIITDESQVYTPHLYCILAEKMEGEAFDLPRTFRVRAAPQHGGKRAGASPEGPAAQGFT